MDEHFEERDLKYIWHPAAQMKDYEELPPMVIDHGKGYMSLYGHNQSLLRQVGQKVEQGEPVALVGDSGGQERSGLYFEIRYQGEAINPTKWLARR